jgi:linker histone H1 and H5 family
MQRQPQHPLTNTPNLSNGTEFKAPFTANPPSVPLTHGSQPPSKPLETTSPAPKQTVAAPGQSSTPTQTVTTAPLVNCPITQPPYPHQPYGFPHQQASYPHAPYYSTTPTSYDYPHSSYPPYPPTNYPQSSKTSFAPPSQSVEAQLSAEDLPSYEDIIVEALMGCPDPEGSVPKNIFTWMSSHYPLQSNFRPSASQALQKAYKRGRFEKSSNGKYRLNPLWEGGSVCLHCCCL